MSKNTDTVGGSERGEKGEMFSKFRPEVRKYCRIGLVALAFAGIAILVVFIFVNIGKIGQVLGKVLSAFSPILVGLALAYIMNPLMMRFEKRITQFLYRHAKNKKKAIKFARSLAIFTTVILVLLFVGFIFYLLIPQLTETIGTLISEVPAQLERFQTWVDSKVREGDNVGALLKTLVDSGTDYLTDFVQNKLAGAATGMLGSVLNGVLSTVKILYNALVGTILAIYILGNKEKLGAQCRKILHAFCKEEKLSSASRILGICHKKFIGAIGGKIIDSLIIGIICFFGMLIFGFPYPTLIAVLVGVTNVIPFFGPYLGGVPSAILVFCASPKQCIWFVIFVLVLQQFDCNFLDPRIVGGSIGLPAYLVLMAVVVFGGLFGIWGLVLGVPITACLYTFFKEIVEAKLKKKNLPLESSKY